MVNTVAILKGLVKIVLCLRFAYEVITKDRSFLHLVIQLTTRLTMELWPVIGRLHGFPLVNFNRVQKRPTLKDFDAL